MSTPMKLTYRDEEGLVVILSEDNDTGPCVHMDVTRIYLHRDERVGYARFEDIKDAQAIARLLVGIEIQEDGAAWKRGPRGQARPTDATGKREGDSGYEG